MTPRNEQAFLQSFSKFYADFCIIFNVRRAATFRCIIPRKQRYHSPLSLLRTVFLLLTSFRLSNRRERMEKSRLIIALPIDFSMRRRPKTGGGARRNDSTACRRCKAQRQGVAILTMPHRGTAALFQHRCSLPIIVISTERQ